MAVQRSDRRPTGGSGPGWDITDLDIGDDEALEYFWPPTAPTDYGGPPEHPLAPTKPWLAPTRITRTDAGWLVQYGEAAAQRPDESLEHTVDATLLADLKRIEWWPMSMEEALQIQRERLFAVTTAAAHEDHYQGLALTEPYRSRIAEPMEHQEFAAAERPSMPHPRGSIDAQLKILDAAAWASALRTSRGGGAG